MEEARCIRREALCMSPSPERDRFLEEAELFLGMDGDLDAESARLGVEEYDRALREEEEWWKAQPSRTRRQLHQDLPYVKFKEHVRNGPDRDAAEKMLSRIPKQRKRAPPDYPTRRNPSRAARPSMEQLLEHV